MKTHTVNLIPCGSITRFPDSQTLFGSICWAIRDLYGEDFLEDMLENFYEHKNRFLVSSVFPEGLVKAPMEIWATVEDTNELLKKSKKDKSAVIKKAKALKKVEYMTLNLFKEYVNGKVNKKELFKDVVLEEEKSKYTLQNKIIALADENIENLVYKIDKGRRNSLNRLSGSTKEGNLYYYNKIFLDKNSKLYFFIKTEDIDFFKPIFKYLSDSSIGADKSIGVNSFKVELESEFRYKKNIDENILLSKYIPYYEEIDWDKSYFKIEFGNYRIESRFEFMGQDVLKDEVGYLVEGSKIVFKEKKEIYGQLPVVKKLNGKKIRHNGIGFFL